MCNKIAVPKDRFLEVGKQPSVICKFKKTFKNNPEIAKTSKTFSIIHSTSIFDKRMMFELSFREIWNMKMGQQIKVYLSCSPIEENSIQT